MPRFIQLMLPLLATFLGACQESEYQRLQDTPAEGITLLQLNPTAGFAMPVVPETNPLTDAKVELGRHLFYDKQLSSNQQQSCESCHEQDKAFSDGVALPHGTTGDLLARNSQTLTNVAYNINYTWANPRLTTLEQQILIPLTAEDPIEIGINDANLNEILQRFRDQLLYQDLFSAAFPEEADPFSLANVIKALASFNRILISDRSPFDRGDLSQSAQRGRDLFFSEKADCFHCHDSFNFSQSSKNVNSLTIPSQRFFNNGLYNLSQDGDYPQNNQGAFGVTGNVNDKGSFRPPTLRNVELTAPYMHDGSIATLEGVVEFYANGGRHIQSSDDIDNLAIINESLGLPADAISHLQGDGRDNPNKQANGFVSGFVASEQEKADLVAFLKSLTDREFITDPRFAKPQALIERDARLN
ncbi:MbnH family di-heme enzyme [Bacterioplanoides sp. SCSIO 12839]|uniref:MbnH family di-heme enzyme n=1 Tax=Bacterioplanoides sp. SCSIO 12839 TaxID=2829569 RepID=UPI00210390B1|nr:MbnH family di-heme enzyme [Bacterioplanoides sp. SCSIO 12839]UTW48694.1 di-heme enzyme [Bacterioplanoides sp. SCSIO 12839]